MSKLDTVIATLNHLEVGSVDQITSQLVLVRAELKQHDVGDLVDKIDQCLDALSRGQLEEFRRLRETVVSRLGHIRVKMS